MRIGQGRWILTNGFSTEPWLIEIGYRVAISSGVHFATHEGTACLLRDSYPNIQVLGRIRIGSNCMIGMSAILLPGTEIGDSCLIGAGSVVKGVIPLDSIVVGNPAKVVGSTREHLEKLVRSPNRLDVWHLEAAERERIIKAHFGVDTPAATRTQTYDRPLGPLR